MNLQAESAVKKLARLPANQICANCGTTKRHGFSTVCIKYHTFVCNLCKTAHQAVSHRCKSLTMSSWDMGEVLTLKKHGNDYARRVWLGNAPKVGEGGRPKDGDDVNVFKRFVVAAYEEKRYYSEPTEGEGSPKCKRDEYVSVNEVQVVTKPQPTARSNVAEERVRRKKNKGQLTSITGTTVHSAPAPVAPTVDLLDFGAIDTSNPSSTSTQPAAPQTNFFADFSAASSLPTSNVVSDETEDFGDFKEATPDITSTTDFGDFSLVTPSSTPSKGNFSQACSTAMPPVAQNFGDFSKTIPTTPPLTTFDPFGNSATVPTISTDNTMKSQPYSEKAINNLKNESSFDLFENSSAAGSPVRNSNAMQMQSSQSHESKQSGKSIMNCNINIMYGGNNIMNSSSTISSMTGKSSFPSNSHGIPNNGMNNTGNSATMNNSMMSNGIGNGMTMNNGMMNNGMMMNKTMMNYGSNMNNLHNNTMLQMGGSISQQQIKMQLQTNNYGVLTGLQQDISSNNGKRDPFAF